jgi:hypothetical protein
MGKLAVPSKQVSKNYKRSVFEHPGKLAVAKHGITIGHCMAKHGITIGHCSQHHSPYTRACVYTHLCVILVFIHHILTRHFIVFLWFPSPVPFLALPFILHFIYLFCFSVFFHHISHLPKQNSAVIHPLVLPVCLVCTWLIHQP